MKIKLAVLRNEREREKKKETEEIKTTLEIPMNKMSVLSYNKEHCE